MDFNVITQEELNDLLEENKKLRRKVENLKHNLDVEIKARNHYHEELIEYSVVNNSLRERLHELGVKTR